MEGFGAGRDAVYEIDHVVLAVSDLDEAGERLRREHGLASVAGGVHEQWGTGNRIVPLGDDYLELLAVLDPEVGRSSAPGRALLEATSDGHDRWLSVCLRVDDIEATAARVGLSVQPGSRLTPEGPGSAGEAPASTTTLEIHGCPSSSPGTARPSCIPVVARSAMTSR
jgi:catechol 2,3-dioxygenase-like lactoylglutathione lyase family enzyme